MDPKVLEFLTSNRMCVLATQLADGAPHTAAMHFIWQDGAIYFSTHNTSQKLTGPASGHTRASVTVGFSEQEWKTFQTNGVIEQLTDPAQKEQTKNLLLTKFPEDAKFMNAETVFLKFTLSWWRYTDFATAPPTIFAS